MKIKYFLFFGFLFFSITSFAQIVRCGTMEYMKQLELENPQLTIDRKQLELQIDEYIKNKKYFRMNSTVTVPVVFHILYNTSSQNISDDRIYEQMRVLNNDFARMNDDTANTPSPFKLVAASTGIQFCLAKQDTSGNETTGIIHKQTSTVSFSQSGFSPKKNSDGGDDPWDRDVYLNIWVCNLAGNLLGYTILPGGTVENDGVVLKYSVVGGPNDKGTLTNYNLGRTATHEVGHWFGLLHTWGDDSGSCIGSDSVADTPNQADADFGCPSFPKISCGNAPNGDMFMNYMDYVDDDCMNMFTAGQSERMWAVIQTYRSSILSAPGCGAPCSGKVLSEKQVIVYLDNYQWGFNLKINFCKPGSVRMMIANMLGQIVYDQYLNLDHSIDEKIIAPVRIPGFYVLSLISADDKVVRKIMVHR